MSVAYGFWLRKTATTGELPLYCGGSDGTRAHDLLRDRKAGLLVDNEEAQAKVRYCNHLDFPPCSLASKTRTTRSSKNTVSLLKSGGREGIRTPALLVANEEKSMIRHGATITQIL